MGLLDRFERNIERVVRRPFAGRGGQLQPVELASALRNTVDREILERQGRYISPNDVVFRFGTSSFEQAKEWGQELAEELCDVLLRYANQQGYTLPGAVNVTFRKDAQISEHDFLVDTSFTDDAGNPLFDSAERTNARKEIENPSPRAGQNAEEGQQPPASAPAAAAEEASRRPARAAAAAPQTSSTSAVRPLNPTPQRPPMQGIITVEGNGYAIEGQRVIIGRSSTADISVNDSGVSRHHVEIFEDADRYMVRDMGSTNGTHLNGFPLTEPSELTDGSLISMSTTRINFRLAEREEPPAPASRFNVGGEH